MRHLDDADDADDDSPRPEIAALGETGRPKVCFISDRSPVQVRPSVLDGKPFNRSTSAHPGAVPGAAANVGLWRRTTPKRRGPYAASQDFRANLPASQVDGQAYVRVPDGAGGRKTVYLGTYDSPASKSAYERVLAEARVSPALAARVGGGITLNVVMVAFLRHAASHYRRPDGTPTNEVVEFKQVCRVLRETYGHTIAASFGPLSLKAVRQRLVDAGLSRGVVNNRVNRVRRLFK